MLQLYFNVLKTKYASFSGRATRREFWLFYLATISIGIGAFLLFALLMTIFKVSTNVDAPGIIFTVLQIIMFGYALGMLIPFYALCVRRLHDFDKSGYWGLTVLIPYIGLLPLVVIGLLEGTAGQNRFGDAPCNGTMTIETKTRETKI